MAHRDTNNRFIGVVPEPCIVIPHPVADTSERIARLVLRMIFTCLSEVVGAHLGHRSNTHRSGRKDTEQLLIIT